MAKSLTEKVDDLLGRAEPLEVLEFLGDVRTRTPELRAGALGMLLAAGWTRYAIAQELGITPQAVQAWDAKKPRKGARS